MTDGGKEGYDDGKGRDGKGRPAGKGRAAGNPWLIAIVVAMKKTAASTTGTSRWKMLRISSRPTPGHA